MKLSTIDKISFILILIIFIVGLYLYPRMPERMPTHWGINGEADGYGNRFIGLFFIPLLLAIIYLIFLAIPKICVHKNNIQSFRKYYEGLKLLFVVFMVFTYAAALLPNFNIEINMTYLIIPALAVLFYYIGYMLKFAKRNYFIGIRTPWTSSSDVVWDKTHKLGSVTFRINAVILLLSLAYTKVMIWVLLGSLLLNVMYLFSYSYFEYKKIAEK